MGAKYQIIGLFLFQIYLVFAQSADVLFREEYSAGSFQKATRIVSESHGATFIIDSDQNKVFLYSDLIQTPKSVGGFGWSDGSFDRPTGVTSDGINIYISDYGNHRIQRFDRNLNPISSFYTRDTSIASARFGYPLDVAVSNLGDLFILDGENLRVLKFSSQNYFERTFGDVNSGEGRLQNPLRLSVLESQVVVCEQSRIVLFDYFGNYIKSIGQGIVSDIVGFAHTDDYYYIASNDTVWRFTQDGVLQNSFPKNYLIAEELIDKIQDISCSGNKLLVLSPHKVYCFQIIN